MLCSICSMRRSILASVKLRSRLFTALNLLPSMATDGLREQIELATQHDELAARVAYRSAVVTAEVGDGLEVWRQSLGQPHEFDIALALALQAAAGLDAIEVAVDVDLQQHRWVIGRSTSDRRINTFEAETSEVEGRSVASRVSSRVPPTQSRHGAL